MAYDAVAASLQLVHVISLTRGDASSRRFRRDIGTKQESTAAHEIVRRVDALYAIEREIKHLSNEERRHARKRHAVPLLESLHAFAKALQTQTLSSGKLGEALAYLTNGRS